MKRRILSLRKPLGHRYTVIAPKISAECRLEFTAQYGYRMYHGLSG